MTRDERRMVKAVHAAAGELLGAKGYAAQYVARIAFTKAIIELQGWATSPAARDQDERRCGMSPPPPPPPPELRPPAVSPSGRPEGER